MGRGLGVGVHLPVHGVGVGVGVGVGLDCAQYLPPVLKTKYSGPCSVVVVTVFPATFWPARSPLAAKTLVPPQTIISLPIQAAV